jgi:hypothetical protein
VGLFDFLNKKNSSPLQKHAARVADRRALAADRWESLQALVKQDSHESTLALLARFTFHADPSITDQEEKETAFKAIMARGATAVEPLKQFITKAESLSWPLKMLDNLLTPDEVLAVLLEQLVKMDTEYERDPQRKLQVLSELEHRHGPGVVAAVIPFFADVNESARFHAIGAAFAQQNAEEARAALVELLQREESVRVRVRALEGYAQRGWVLEPTLAARLPDGWALDAGVPKRR